MASEPLIEELQLDIQPALDALEPLGAALTELATNFGSALVDAISGVSSAIPTDSLIDPGQLTASIDTAIGDVSAAPIPVEGDTTTLESGIADALDQPRPPIPVDADTSLLDTSISDAVAAPQAPVTVEGDTGPLSDAIDAATAGAQPVVPVTADTTDAQSKIDELSAAPVEVPVTADTTDAQSQIDELGASATTAAGGGGGGGGGFGALDAAILGVNAATGLAEGHVGNLSSSLGLLNTDLAAGVAAGTAFTAFLGETVNLAANAQAQQNRFNSVFGATADLVNHIDVGGLNLSLQQLAAQSGTTEAAVQSSASRIGQLGFSSGAASGQVVQTTKDVLALAAAASVTNPQLGDTGQVADRLTRLLATGGQRLAQYGISLSAGAINAEAMKLGLADTAAQLTPFDKLVAGATLAVQQQGDALGTKFAQGAQNAQVQLRALKVALEETLVAIGQPLLEPVVNSMKALIPVAEQVGIVLGDVGQIVLPLFADLAPVLGAIAVPLKLVGDGLVAVSDAAKQVENPLGLAAAGLIALSAILPTDITLATAFGAALDIATGPIGAFSLVLGVLAGAGLLSHFSHDAQQASTDTSALASVFDTTSSSTATLGAAFARLNDTVDQYLVKQLDIGNVGSRPIDALNALGLSTQGLRDILLGGQSAFDKFDESLLTGPAVTNDNADAFTHLSNVVDDTRQQLEANAAAALQTAIQTGVLTEANSGNAVAFNEAKFAGQDALQLLQELQPAIDRATHARQANTDAEFAASDSGKQLAQSVQDGTVALKDASTVANEYGISVQEATTAIQDAEKAQDSHAASLARSSAAFADLTRQVAEGTITEGDGIAALQAMGFSADGAAAEFKSLQSTIDKTLSSLASSLPSAADAAKTWQQDVSAAFKQLSDDASKHTGNIKQDLATLAADSDPTTFAQNLFKQGLSVLAFENNLKTLLAQGRTDLIAFLVQQPVDVAGPLAAQLASHPAQAKFAEGMIAAAGGINDGLVQFVARNADKIHLDGNQLGQLFGGGIADGVTGSTPKVTTAAAAVAVAAADRFHPDFTHPVSAAVDAAANALAADPTISQKAGDKGLEALRAYEDKFGPIPLANAVQVALGGAHDAIAADSATAQAAGQKGADASGAFSGKLTPAQAAQKKFSDAAAAISGLTDVQFATGVLGVEAGQAFVQGLANGINPDTNASGATAVANASAAIADIAITTARNRFQSKSPSQVAFRIGHDFGTGLALGVNESTGIVQDSAAHLADALTAGVTVTSTPTTIAGFNDPATLSEKFAELTKLLAAAQASAASASATLGPAGQSLAQFVSSAVGQLPTVGSDISTFSQNLTSALSAQTTALDAVHKAYGQYAKDQAAQEKLAHDAGIAFGVLAAAQAKLAADTAAHAPKLTITEDTLGVKQAQSAFDSLANNLNSAKSQTDQARAGIASAATQLGDAQKALAAASNPQAFIRSITSQTAEARRFLADIAKLVHEGDTDLAKQLAEAGPATAGHLADALAASPAKAKTAEAAIDQATQFSKTFQDQLDKLFGTGQKQAAQAGHATGVALTGTLGSSVTTGTAQTLQALQAQLGAVQPTVRVQATLPGPGAIPVETVPLTFQPEVGPIAASLAALPQLHLDAEVIPHLRPLPKLPPISVEVIPHLGPVAANAAPFAGQAPTVAGTSGPSTFALDLTVVLDNGRTVKATVDIPVPKPVSSVGQRVRTEVHAS